MGARGLIGTLAAATLATTPGVGGCNEEEKPAAAQPAVPPRRAEAASAHDPGAQPVHRRLLAWLSPDATAVLFSRLPRDLDVSALATIFALPPRTAKLLRRVAELPTELEAIAAPGRATPAEWLGKESLALVPGIGSGVYVITAATLEEGQIKEHLRAAGMVDRKVDGYPYFERAGAFPWRIVFLGEGILGFIPAGEVGSGLTPLTAARDLPPSEMERELGKVLDEDPGAVAELFNQGPLLHLDLDQDLIGVRLGLRRLKDGGLDGVLLLQVPDVAAAARQLRERSLGLETDTVANLGTRVAFTEDGPMVQGRLQLSRDDLASLKRAP